MADAENLPKRKDGSQGPGHTSDATSTKRGSHDSHKRESVPEARLSKQDSKTSHKESLEQSASESQIEDLETFDPSEEDIELETDYSGETNEENLTSREQSISDKKDSLKVATGKQSLQPKKDSIIEAKGQAENKVDLEEPKQIIAEITNGQEDAEDELVKKENVKAEKKIRRNSPSRLYKNIAVVYEGDQAEDDYLYYQNYDMDTYNEDFEEDDEEDEEEEETLYDIGENDTDEMWEDDDIEMNDDDDGEAALLALEMEKERVRQERLAEIKRKKDALIDRYLKTARIMIHHRKKNIYLQDYLFQLGQRKGILRGDPQAHVEIDESASTVSVSKLQKKKMKKKNAIMASRFARFLRKTGHLMDDDDHVHHHHRHHHHIRRNSPPTKFRGAAEGGRAKSRHFNHAPHHNHHHHHHRHNLPNTTVRKQMSRKLCKGKECMSKHFKHRKNMINRRSPKRKFIKKKAVKRPLTLKERLEIKAAHTMKTAVKKDHTALTDMEGHRCKMVKKRDLIKIRDLLNKQYSGTEILDSERTHLIFFVEKSVTAQNLAKRKALRRQNKPEKTGTANMNHQWIKSLERIRELRIRKAKLEQEHRLQLIRKVKHWHVWEKRDVVALDAVYDFISKMGSRVIMTRRETEAFATGLDQFQKQLHLLYNAMIPQLIKMFRVQSMLFMAQRKVKDNASVLSIKGFTINDYERMVIENQESHEKMVEKQGLLVEEYEKLRKLIKDVAYSHTRKQRSWGALRVGRHDTKALWELCSTERDNLLKKLKELKKSNRIHQKMFMQISILENKNCFMDYQRVKHNVKELQDKRRSLMTQLHQAESTLRILSVRMTDTENRVQGATEKEEERAAHDEMSFYKETIRQRITPRLPNTIYDVNIISRKSQKILLRRGTHFKKNKATKSIKPMEISLGKYK